MKINELVLNEIQNVSENDNPNIPIDTVVDHAGSKYKWNGHNWINMSKGSKVAKREVQDVITKDVIKKLQKPKGLDPKDYRNLGRKDQVQTTPVRGADLPDFISPDMAETIKEIKQRFMPFFTQVSNIDDLFPGASFKRIPLNKNLFMDHPDVNVAVAFYLKTPRGYERLKDKSVISKIAGAIVKSNKELDKAMKKRGDFFDPGAADRSGFGTLSNIEQDKGLLGKLGITQDRLGKLGVDRLGKTATAGTRLGAKVDQGINSLINRIKGKGK